MRRVTFARSSLAAIPESEPVSAPVSAPSVPSKDIPSLILQTARKMYRELSDKNLVHYSDIFNDPKITYSDKVVNGKLEFCIDGFEGEIEFYFYQGKKENFVRTTFWYKKSYWASHSSVAKVTGGTFTLTDRYVSRLVNETQKLIEDAHYEQAEDRVATMLREVEQIREYSSVTGMHWYVVQYKKRLGDMGMIFEYTKRNHPWMENLASYQQLKSCIEYSRALEDWEELEEEF